MTSFYTTIAQDQVRAYMPSTPVMVTATSYWRAGQRSAKWRDRILPVRLPQHVPEIAADSGGFEAARRHGGRYPFGFEAYLSWLRSIPRLTWAALPDLPVERELAPTYMNLRRRQELTLEWARQLWVSPSCDKWDGYRGQPWAWVATIQGREVADYVWMAEQLAPLIQSQRFQYVTMAHVLGAIADRLEPAVRQATWQTQRWAARNAEHFRIGIGSLCKRINMQAVVAIVRAVAEVLPTERFHLWGVKLNAIDALREACLLDRIASIDSAAWNNRFGTDLERQKVSTLSQRAFCWRIAWPEYRAKIDAALAKPRPNGWQPELAL